MLLFLHLEVSAANVVVAAIAVGLGAVVARIFYNLYLHPLAGFPGPWHAASTSLVSTIVSLRRIEPQWFMGLVEKYGGMITLFHSYALVSGKASANIYKN